MEQVNKVDFSQSKHYSSLYQVQAELDNQQQFDTGNYRQVREAAKILSQVVGVDYPEYGTTNHAPLLKALTQPSTDSDDVSEWALLNKISGQIEQSVNVRHKAGETPEDYQARLKQRRDTVWSTCIDVYSKVRPFRIENVIKRTTQEAPPEVRKAISPPRYEIQEYAMGGNILQLIAPVGTSPDDPRISSILANTELVWSSLEPNTSHQVQTLCLYMDKQRQATFAPFTTENGIMLDMGLDYMPELNGQQISDFVTLHEVIHSICLKEGWDPNFYLLDLMEGLATKLSRSFDGYRDRKGADNPAFYSSIAALSRRDTKPGRPLASATQLLEQIPKKDKPKDPGELPYIYGYCLISSILKSKRHNDYARQAFSQGKSPYGLIFEIGRSVSRLVRNAPDNVKVRDLHRWALEENGFDSRNIFEGADWELQLLTHEHKSLSNGS